MGSQGRLVCFRRKHLEGAHERSKGEAEEGMALLVLRALTDGWRALVGDTRADCGTRFIQS